MDRVLIVHESEDLRDVLGGLLRKELGVHIPVAALAAYEEAAYAAVLGATCQFALLGAAAPAKCGGAPDNVKHGAIKAFLGHVLNRRPALPLLVLAAEEDHELCRLVEAHPHGRVAIVSPASDWRHAARSSAREAFGLEGRQPIDARRTRSVLQIVVANHSQGQWTMERRGRIEGKREGALDLDPISFHD